MFTTPYFIDFIYYNNDLITWVMRCILCTQECMCSVSKYVELKLSFATEILPPPPPPPSSSTQILVSQVTSGHSGGKEFVAWVI